MQSLRFLGILLAGFPVLLSANSPSPARVQLTPLEDRVRIEIGGQLFTEYLFKDATKPYLYPILNEDGTGMTRNFPMKEVPNEAHDHPHHRGLSFTHGLVNGHDFWSENPKAGLTVHEAIVEATSGREGILRTRNRWETREGVVVCTEDRTIRVQAVPGGRTLDFIVTLHASHGPLVLGDTKEGSMSIRLNEAMRLRQGAGRNSVPGTGRIVNSEGVRDGETWGKRAAWCDYYGPVNGKVIGVAIFDHPSNPRHPTWWHVRDYGLFAANPFGQHDFEKLSNASAGDLHVAAGQSVTFRYRFYFHTGDEREGRVAEQYEAFARTK